LHVGEDRADAGHGRSQVERYDDDRHREQDGVTVTRSRGHPDDAR
jgi:hypothetical protein